MQEECRLFSQIKTRRDFLKTLMVGSASLFHSIPFSKSLRAGILTLDPRSRVPNPYVTPDGKPLLVCISGTDYTRMLAAGLNVLGGLDRLIDNNQDILIKPNLVYTEEYPTTSSVDSIVATIEAVFRVSSGAVRVGDCGGIDNQEIYDYLNLEPAISEAGGELIIFSDTYDVRRETWDPEVPDFMVFADVYDAPIIISLCSLKRHRLAFLTCAIKNHVGTLSGPDRADTRGYIHSFPGESDEFLQVIAETGGLIDSELTIVDAREIMAIDGPLRIYGGEIREVNKIVICGDMVAADAYCAQIMQENDETFDSSWIQPTLEQAEELGLGTADLNQVEIIEINETSSDESNGHGLPVRFGLHQNYPNPFNARTTIRYDLPEPHEVTIDIYDSLGRKIETLVKKTQGIGRHHVIWNAADKSSGMYFYRIQAGEYTKTRKMVLLR
jgi:uncharacterized protein (DUF362 family)